MTNDELLELAPLDALGLLDEYDALLFARAFHAASDKVRERVRELQSEVAGDDALLPDVDLPVGMRSRVVDAVRREANEAADTRPLATIGAVRPGSVLHTLDRPGTVTRRNSSPPRRSWVAGLGAHGWRAAAFALSASLIVTLYFASQSRTRNEQLAALTDTLLAGDDIESALAALGGDVPRFSDLASGRNTRQIALSATDASGPVGMTGFVMVDVERGEGLALAFGLPSGGGDLRLVVRDANGQRVTESPIRRGRGMAAVGLEVSGAILAVASFEIIDASGTVLMAS